MRSFVDGFSVRDLSRRSGWACLSVVVALGVALGCSWMPSLEEQSRHVKANELLLHQLTPPAFLDAWGPPAYQHVEFMQFFVMDDKSLIPRSRVGG